MTKKHDHSEESESTTAREADHNRRNELQSQLIREELERIRRTGHSPAAIRRGMRKRSKDRDLTTDR